MRALRWPAGSSAGSSGMPRAAPWSSPAAKLRARNEPANCASAAPGNFTSRVSHSSRFHKSVSRVLRNKKSGLCQAGLHGKRFKWFRTADCRKEWKNRKKNNLKRQSYWGLHRQISNSHSALSFIVSNYLVVKCTSLPALFSLKADRKRVIVLITNDNLI